LHIRRSQMSLMCPLREFCIKIFTHRSPAWNVWWLKKKPKEAMGLGGGKRLSRLRAGCSAGLFTLLFIQHVIIKQNPKPPGFFMRGHTHRHALTITDVMMTFFGLIIRKMTRMQSIDY